MRILLRSISFINSRKADLAFERTRMTREKMKVWIKVFSFIEVGKEEEEEYDGCELCMESGFEYTKL